LNSVNTYNKHKEQINYLLVGIWNTIFGYAAFAALYFLLRGYLHYMILFVISTLLSITNAYLAYKLFVFKTKGHYWREYSRFYAVYGGALALNLALLPLVVVTFHLSPVIAQAGLSFITVIFSYFGHKNFSFKTPATAVALILLFALFAAARPAGADVNLLDQYYTWGTISPQTVVTPADGGLKITSSGGFAGFYNQKMASALLEDNGLLVLEMKTSTGRTGTIFWSNYQDQRFLPQRSWQFYLGRPGVWHRYYIDLGAREKELARLDYLLINPFSGSGEAQIRDLRIIKGTLTDRLRAGWQEFLGAKGREVVGYTINTMPSVMLFGREIFVYIYWLVALLAAAFLALELWPVWRRPEKVKAGKGKEKKTASIWSKYEPAFNRAVKKIFISVLVLWAALELSSLYSDWLNLRNDLPLFAKNIEEKRTLANTGDFYPFIQFCQAKLPLGVPFDMRIPPIYNDIKAIYYLYPHMNTTEADYLIVYDQPLEPELRGRYEPVAVFRPNALILKKVKN
jgi:putative flippase GtrA